MSSLGSDPPSCNQPLDESSDTPDQASCDQPSHVPSGGSLQGSSFIGETPQDHPLDDAFGNPSQAPDTLDNEATDSSDSTSVNSESPMCPSPGKTYQGQRRRPAVSASLSPLLEESPLATPPSIARRVSRGSPVHAQRTIYSSSSTPNHSSPRQGQPASTEPYPTPQFRSARSQSSAARAEAAAARQPGHEVPSIHPHVTPPLPQPPLPRLSSANIRDQAPIPRPLPPYELRVNLMSFDQVEDLFHDQYHQYYKPVFEQLRREMQYLQGKFDKMDETILENRRILHRLNTLHDDYAQHDANYAQHDANYAAQHHSQINDQYRAGYSYNDPSNVGYNYSYNYNEQNNPSPEPSPTHSDQNHSYRYDQATYGSDSDEENGELKNRNRNS